jgi:uncharacterized membrane protein
VVDSNVLFRFVAFSALALVFVVALLVALLMRVRRPMCPHCGEVVKPNASVCPHCQRVISGTGGESTSASAPTSAVLAVRRQHTSDPLGPSRNDASGDEGDAAVNIARERYSRGEITREEFVEIRNELVGIKPE